MSSPNKCASHTLRNTLLLKQFLMLKKSPTRHHSSLKHKWKLKMQRQQTLYVCCIVVRCTISMPYLYITTFRICIANTFRNDKNPLSWSYYCRHYIPLDLIVSYGNLSNSCFKLEWFWNLSSCYSN